MMDDILDIKDVDYLISGHEEEMKTEIYEILKTIENPTNAASELLEGTFITKAVYEDIFSEYKSLDHESASAEKISSTVDKLLANAAIYKSICIAIEENLANGEVFESTSLKKVRDLSDIIMDYKDHYVSYLTVSGERVVFCILAFQNGYLMSDFEELSPDEASEVLRAIKEKHHEKPID